MTSGGQRDRGQPSPPRSASACLSDTEIALLACRRVDTETPDSALRHLDACDTCRGLVADMAHASAASGASGDRALREPLEEPPRELEAGARVGRYVVLHRLGQGGMGVVYCAYDPTLDRNVALKILRTSRRDAPFPELEREAQSLARVSHPHVVAVYDVTMHDQCVTLVMELVNGTTLRAWLTARPRTPREILELLAGAGNGLVATHQAGMVHRDVKPENILIDRGGRAKISDFGLAVVERRRDTPGLITGTLPYMAPEQLRGDGADTRSDQFAFASVLCEALTGVLPFAGTSAASRLGAFEREKKPHEASRAPSSIPPAPRGVPRRAWSAVRRALELDPERRFPSMKELLAELLPPSRSVRAATLAVVAGAIVVGGSYATVHERRLERAAFCQGADGQLAGVWDEGRRGEVQAAFRAHTELPFVETSLSSTAAALDTYATSWARARTGVCEATRVRGEQSEALMDQRMACLDDRKRELGALVSEFVHPSSKAVERAVQATGSLSDIQTCTQANPATLRPRPQDPAEAARLESLLTRIAQARAKYQVGDIPPAKKQIEGMLPEIREAKNPRILAEGELLLGQANHYSALMKEAEQAYLEAAWAAESGGDDETAAHAYVFLSQVLGTGLADQSAGIRYERFAEAAIDRLGSPPELQASLLRMQATRLSVGSQHEQAALLARRAIDILNADGKGGTVLEAMCWNVVGASRTSEYALADAREALRHAIEIDERVLGKLHPAIIPPLNNLSVVELEDGLWDDALRTIDRVLEVAGARVGGDTYQTALAHENRGTVLLKTHDLPGARNELARALAIDQKVLGDHPYTARTLGELAQLDRIEGHAEFALAGYARARQTLSHAKTPNAEVLGLIATGEGEALLDAGRLGDAEKVLAEANKVLEDGSPDPMEVADAKFALARALDLAKRDGDRSTALAKAAATTYEKSPRGQRAELDAVRDWLAKRGAEP